MVSNSYYTVFTGEDSQYYFNLKAGNHEIILQSEGYKNKQSALNGISSVQKNCMDDENYIKKTAKDDSPYFVLEAKNGEPIGRSEMYSSEQMRDKGIESVKSNGTSTTIKGDSKHTFQITINKSLYTVDDKEMSGAEILALAELSSSQYSLFLVKGVNQEEIKATDMVKMRNNLCFQAIISNIQFG